MAKLTITLAALLVALFVVDSATTSTTTIITTIIDVEMGVSECSQQIQPQQQLQQCMKYLSPMKYAMNAQEQHLEECCQEMRSIDRSCRCMAIKEMVKQQQRGQRQTEQMQQMVQDAQNLPSKCNLEISQQCQIRAAYF